MNTFQLFAARFIVCAALLQVFASSAQSMTTIAAGDSHSLFVKSDGSLWATGNNVYGQLGDGTYDDTNLPEMIVSSNVTAVVAGSDFSLFLKNDGSLWGNGWNNDGELGDGTQNLTNRPEMLVASNVMAMAAFHENSFFIKRDGSLWAMGRNDFGQLGTVTHDGTLRPEMIFATNVVAVAAGGTHTLFLTADGSLWAMGVDGEGQLFDGGGIPQPLPAYITNGVKAIAAGWYHSLVLMTNGSLWAAGDNEFGEIGDGDFADPVATPFEVRASNVVAIAAGPADSFFLMSDGSLWGMGQNDRGQLGDGQMNPDYPQAGTNQPQRVLIDNVVAFTGGEYQTLFIKNDGSIWGAGQSAELGVGDFFKLLDVPVEIVAGPPGYNKISPRLINGGNMALAYKGNAYGRYILERAFSLIRPHWVPQATNTADSLGTLVFTNSLVLNSNIFWRVRAAP